MSENMSENETLDNKTLDIYINNTGKQVYIAIDIETGGAGFQHPVIAVGVCYGNTKGYYKKLWCIDFNVNDFERNCYNEFWSKHGAILNDFKKEAVNADVTWLDIGRFFDNLENEFPDANFVIVSDNPAFDIARVDYEMFTRLNRLGCRHIGKYRKVIDPTEQRLFFPEKVQMKELVKSLAPHTHYPDDDAEGLFFTTSYFE